MGIQWIRKHRVNSLRIDFTPTPHANDLAFGEAQRLLGATKHGLIRSDRVTLKYTSSLHINCYLKPPYTKRRLKALYKLVRRVRKVCNHAKITPVRAFTSCIKNIHGSGHLNAIFTPHLWSTIDVRCETSLQYEVGVEYTEPTVPVKSIEDIASYKHCRFVHLVYVAGSVLRINRSGSFTIIASSLEEYRHLLELVLCIAKQIFSNNK